MKRMWIKIVFISIFFSCWAQAIPSSLTYQGRILRPNGQGLEYNNVSFLFQILNPAGDCVVYQEQASGINMTSSGGVFDISIGTNTVQYLPTGNTNILDVISSTNPIECANCTLVGASYTCSGNGTNYSPSPNDILKLRTSFHDGSGWKVISPDNEIRTVPFAGKALVAEKIGSAREIDILTKALAPLCIAPNSFLQWNGLDFDCVAITSAPTPPAGSDGFLQFNDSGAFAGTANLFWDKTTSRLGVGTSTPNETLSINGAVQIGVTSSTCTNANKGSVRYNNSTNVLEFCNGTSWNLLQAAACSDTTPNVFSFADEANATPSSLYESNIIQLSGINCSVPVTIAGQGSPQYRICDDVACVSVRQDWTSSPSSISNNQFIQVRLTTDAVGGAPFKATVIVGSGASVWTVTNAGGDCSGSPSIGTVCADGTLYAGLSPDGNQKMFTTRCDAGQTWNGVSCTGTRSLITWNNGTTNWGYTGFSSNVTGKSNSAGLAALADSASPYSAAQYCESLNVDGHSDWYLPAIAELSILYSNRSTLRNFTSNRYWSSSDTSYNSSIAQVFNFADGTSVTDLKNNSWHIRCVRR